MQPRMHTALHEERVAGMTVASLAGFGRGGLTIDFTGHSSLIDVFISKTLHCLPPRAVPVLPGINHASFSSLHHHLTEIL